MKTNQSMTKPAIIAMATLLLGAVGCEYHGSGEPMNVRILRGSNQQTDEGIRAPIEGRPEVLQPESISPEPSPLKQETLTDTPRTEAGDTEDAVPPSTQPTPSRVSRPIVPIERSKAPQTSEDQGKEVTKETPGPIAKALDVQDVDPNWQPAPEGLKKQYAVGFTNPTWVLEPGTSRQKLSENQKPVYCEMKCTQDQVVVGINKKVGSHATDQKISLTCASFTGTGLNLGQTSPTASCSDIRVEPGYAPFEQDLNVDHNDRAAMGIRVRKVAGFSSGCSRLLSATVRLGDADPITREAEEDCNGFGENWVWDPNSKKAPSSSALYGQPSGDPFNQNYELGPKDTSDKATKGELHSIECAPGYLMTGLRTVSVQTTYSIPQFQGLEIECSKLERKLFD